MKQFILNKEPGKDNLVRLAGDDYHYLVRVRRLAAGEFFPALLPNGEETQIQILSIDGDALTGKCQQNAKADVNHSNDCRRVVSSPCEVCHKIILFQALPKADKMDLIVRQAAEGGIAEIVPFVSEFSVAKTNAGGQKYARWERIIKEARQQSGSKIATALHNPLTTAELLDYWKKLNEGNASQNSAGAGAMGLLFHHPAPEFTGAKVLAQKSLHGYLNSNPGVVALVVGPEGGFSNAEVTLFMENGFNPITIGDTVLRTETAALYCAAAIRVLLLEKNSWELKKS